MNPDLLVGHWMYHPEHEQTMHCTAEAVARALANGWVDSPEKLETKTGIHPSDKPDVDRSSIKTEVLKHLDAGMRQRDIVKLLGLSKGYVSKIAKRSRCVKP